MHKETKKYDIETSYRSMIKAASLYMPFLNNASYLQSHFGFKGINPKRAEHWERETSINDFGYGFYSLISGKILSSESISEQLLDKITNWCKMN